MAYYYGYQTEYICDHSWAWRRLLIDRILIEKSQDKLWDLEQTILTHSPNTENDASRMSNRIKDISDGLQETLMIAQKLLTIEDILAKRAADDGVMRYVE